MLNLAEMVVLACENWQSKADFNVVCRPHRERPGAYHIVLNGKHFGFDGNSTPFNPLNASKLCRSKIDTIELVSQVDLKTGVLIPKTRAYFDPSFFESGVQDEKIRMFRENNDDISADVAGVFSFPVIVKPNSKSMSLNSSLVRTPEELHAALDRVFADASSYDSDAVVQERIDIQTEYRAVCFDGHSMMMIERDISNAEPNEILNPVFWEGTRSKLVRDEELEAVGEEIATFLKVKTGLRYTGFDLARDRDGKIWFIEANSAPMIAVGELLHEEEGLQAIRDLTDTMFIDMAHQAGIDLG